MKITITRKIEIDAKFIGVSAGVRYFEDATINGIEDNNGDLIPFKDGELWSPKINIDGGFIVNWPKGMIADIHYKVCDQCSFSILDESSEEIYRIDNDYVPNFLCPEENGYGDYIIMKVDENGYINKWSFDPSELEL